MGKSVSLIVKIYSALFGSICYVAYFIMTKKLPTQSMVSGIVIMMFAFESMVLSIDTSIVIKNIKNKKEDLDVPNNSSTEQLKNAVLELIRIPVDEINTNLDKEIKDRLTDIKAINDNLTKNIRNIAYPIGYHYIQVCEDNGIFDSNKSPAVLFGGTWSIKRNTQGVTLRTEGGKADEGGRDGNGIQQWAIENITGSVSIGSTAALAGISTFKLIFLLTKS